MIRRPPRSTRTDTLFPYTTLFRSDVLVHFDRNGFAYTIDRGTGELLVAEKYDPAVNWATGIDMETGQPQVVAKYSTDEQGEDTNVQGICPASVGTKDQQPASYSPRTGLFYVPTNHVCMDYEPFRVRSEEHTSELQSLMRISYAVFCLKKKNKHR